MIRITQQSNATSAKGCYAPASYYREGRGIIGCWGGQGASRLGLEGTVDQLRFERLCDNENPRTGNRVTARMRWKRTVGYNFKFSPCKSVSLLYGLNQDQALLHAFRSEVDETMREIEREMRTRVRKSRQNNERVTGNMVWAQFIHTTACPVKGVCDPQLHAYVLVFNMTWDEQEKRWKAGKFRELKRDAPYFQAAFRVRLANKLQELGFGIERRGDDFEIAGIPAEVLKRFSRRTEVVERLAQERGITNPKWKGELGPKTRESRGKPCSLVAQRKEWNRRLTREERAILASAYRREIAFAQQRNEEAWAVYQAIRHCLAAGAIVPERRLVTEALKRGLGAVTVEGVAQELAKHPLIRNEVGGCTMVRFRSD